MMAGLVKFTRPAIIVRKYANSKNAGSVGFENVAFSDKATCSQRKVIIICLNSCVNTSGHALPHSTVIASCLLRISKLDPDLHSRFVLPCKEFDTGNE